MEKQKKSFNKIVKPIQVAPLLSKEQSILQELFGGSEPIWGTGEDLPKLEGVLFQGNGLIKSGDDFDETAGLFGI